MNTKTILLRSSTLLAVLAFPAISNAQLLSNGTGGGDWNDVATWNGGATIPTAGFNIQEGDVVTAGAGATLSSTSADPKIFGTLTIDGGDISVRRLGWNTTTSGTLNMKSGTFTASRLATANESTFTYNLTGGRIVATEVNQAVKGGNTFNISGGQLSVNGPLSGIIHLSGGSIEFASGMSSFGMSSASNTWNGGRVYANTHSMSVGGWSGVQAKWASNAINELAISSKDTAQTFTITHAVNVAQGTLVFNIYSPTENDLFVANSLVLGDGVLIKMEGVNLEGSLDDYLGASFKILESGNNNYGSISATVAPSTLTIGGTTYDDIWWNTTNLTLDGTVTLVPEPSTYALIFGGLAIGLAIIRRRKQAA